MWVTIGIGANNLKNFTSRREPFGMSYIVSMDAVSSHGIRTIGEFPALADAQPQVKIIANHKTGAV